MATTIQPVDRPQRYEERLRADLRWGMAEAEKFFIGGGRVNTTLDRITQRLDAIGVPYAVAGALALFRHGLQRFTDDVDILVTRDGVRTIHERLVGLGFVPVFTGSKNLRDVETGVKIEFLTSGDYPGDGKPKAISFPEPDRVSVVLDGVRCLSLPALVELKLASGLSAAHRGKDLTDIQELIRTARLRRDLSDQLHPDVRAKYLELWSLVPRRFIRPVPTATLSDPSVVAMLADGVTVAEAAPLMPDYTALTTSDPAVAAKYGLVEEADLTDGAGPGTTPGG